MKNIKLFNPTNQSTQDPNKPITPKERIILLNILSQDYKVKSIIIPKIRQLKQQVISLPKPTRETIALHLIQMLRGMFNNHQPPLENAERYVAYLESKSLDMLIRSLAPQWQRN